MPHLGMAGGITEFVRKSRITPVLAVLVAFIIIDLSVAMPAQLEKMQVKAKATGLDGFDWFIFCLLFGGCIGKTMAAFMNKGWTRYADERDAEHQEEKRKSNGTTPPTGPTEADGGNLRK